MNSKPIFQSKTVLTILAALMIPEVMDVINLDIVLAELEALKIFFSDYVITLDELVQTIFIVVAAVFRFRATTTLTLKRVDENDTLTGKLRS